MEKAILRIISVLCAMALCTSYAAAADPVTPHASPEARALLNFLHAMYGKKTLSGQMWAPFGSDEIETVHKIHEAENVHENQLAIEWWKAGGIPTIMWHWGAPSKGEGYEESRMTIDIDRCFQPGTAENIAMWSDLKRIACRYTWLTCRRIRCE
jgi:hypothetical protein